jgi:hypothetical protein
VLDPKPAFPLSLGHTRPRSGSPTQADGYTLILIDPALLRIGQKVTSISHVGSPGAPSPGDGRRGAHGEGGHSETPLFAARGAFRPGPQSAASAATAATAATRDGRGGRPAENCTRAASTARAPEAIRIRSTRRPTVRTCPFQPRGGCRWENSHRSRYFGGPANSESPVALRPPLTRGLPFRLASLRDAARFHAPSQCIAVRESALQPVGNRGAMKRRLSWESGASRLNPGGARQAERRSSAPTLTATASP